MTARGTAALASTLDLSTPLFLAPMRSDPEVGDWEYWRARLATGCLLGSCAQVRGWQSQLDFTRLVDSGMSPASKLPSRATSIALLVAVWKYYILVWGRIMEVCGSESGFPPRATRGRLRWGPRRTRATSSRARRRRWPCCSHRDHTPTRPRTSSTRCRRRSSRPR